MRINSRSFSGDSQDYELENVYFNLKGDCFGFNDFILILTKKTEKKHLESMFLNISDIKLGKSDIKSYNFKIIQDNETWYLNIRNYALKFIPKTCTDLTAKVEYVANHESPFEIGQIYPLYLYPSEWWEIAIL